MSISNTPYDTFIAVLNMLPAEERTIQFYDWDAYIGNYVITCSTSLDIDQKASNNYKAKTVLVSAWVFKPDIPVNRDNRKVKYGTMTYASDFNKIFALKGATNEFWCYNITANRWESLPHLPLAPSGKKPKAGCDLTFGQGRKIFAIKGGSKYDFYVYDILDSTWTSLAPIWDSVQNTQPPKDGAGIVYSNFVGLIYAIIGNNSPLLLSYIPGTPPQGGYWRFIDQLPSLYYGTKGFKQGASIHCVDSMLYIFMGNKMRDLCRYDLSRMSWIEERCTIPGVKNVVKAGGTATYHQPNNTFYFFLGGNKQAMWKYNLNNNSFDSTSSIPRGPRKKKIKTGAAIIAAGENDPLFILKGNNTTEFWAYAHWATGTKTEKLKENKIPLANNLSALSFINSLNGSDPVIHYSLYENSRVNLKLYTVTGQLLKTLIEQEQQPGSYSLPIKTNDLINNPTAGIYFIKGNLGSLPVTKKIIIF